MLSNRLFICMYEIYYTDMKHSECLKKFVVLALAKTVSSELIKRTQTAVSFCAVSARNTPYCVQKPQHFLFDMFNPFYWSRFRLTYSAH